MILFLFFAWVSQYEGSVFCFCKTSCRVHTLQRPGGCRWLVALRPDHMGLGSFYSGPQPFTEKTRVLLCDLTSLRVLKKQLWISWKRRMPCHWEWSVPPGAGQLHPSHSFRFACPCAQCKPSPGHSQKPGPDTEAQRTQAWKICSHLFNKCNPMKKQNSQWLPSLAFCSLVTWAFQKVTEIEIEWRIT